MLNPIFSLATGMEGISPSPAWLQPSAPALGASGWSLDVPIAQLFMDASPATPGCRRDCDVRASSRCSDACKDIPRCWEGSGLLCVCVRDTGDGQ